MTNNQYAFRGCKSISFIQIPTRVKILGQRIFTRLSALELDNDSNNEYFTSFFGILLF